MRWGRYHSSGDHVKEIKSSMMAESRAYGTSWGQTRAHSRVEMGGGTTKERANDNKDVPFPTM